MGPILLVDNVNSLLIETLARADNSSASPPLVIENRHITQQNLPLNDIANLDQYAEPLNKEEGVQNQRPAPPAMLDSPLLCVVQGQRRGARGHTGSRVNRSGMTRERLYTAEDTSQEENP